MNVTAEDLVRRLEAERAVPESQRSTRATDVSLDGAIERLRRIEGHLAEGTSCGMLPEELAHLVTDSWDWHADLTSEVLRFKQNLGRAAGSAGS